MEVKYRSACGRYEVLFEAKEQKDIFAQVANFQEVFEDDTSVNINGINVPVTDIRFRVRTVDDNEFYEKVYVGSNKDLFGYKLEYGTAKKGGSLFPKRKDKDGTYYKNNGWHKWDGKASEGDAPKDEPKKSSAPKGKTDGNGKDVPF